MDWGATQGVLISGGTGSLGTALCHRIAQLDKPPRTIIFSRDWHKQAALRSSLSDPPWARWFVGDVRDKDRLLRALDGVGTVIHAAAIKDVISCEYNPSEAVATNVLGTQNIIEAAIDRGVRRVIVISTDKACSAVNAYGRSKAMAESLAVAANSYAGRGPTRFGVARYGNVLGSSGSVVPLFREQAKTGRVTITDRRMTRFWIPMEDAVGFILRCLVRMRGGEIFVPKICSASVAKLASIIAPGAEQVETGIRPGEKLHETLITEDDARRVREHERHYVICPQFPFWDSAWSDEGTPVPEAWRYDSKSNPWRLGDAELRIMLEAAA